MKLLLVIAVIIATEKQARTGLVKIQSFLAMGFFLSLSCMVRQWWALSRWHFFLFLELGIPLLSLKNPTLPEIYSHVVSCPFQYKRTSNSHSTLSSYCPYQINTLLNSLTVPQTKINTRTLLAFLTPISKSPQA